MQLKTLHRRRRKHILLIFLLSVAGMTKTSAQIQGALNGVFSVSENTQVCFSQGNLQYQASTNTWRFAENQWDFIGGFDGGGYNPGQYGTVTGSSNNSISSTYAGWIDLFGWGTSGYNHGATCYQPWSITQQNNAYYAYGGNAYDLYDQTGQADWGYNPISNGGNTENSGWRTLTSNEWGFVINMRTTASGIRWARGSVNGVDGVILLPDNWNSDIYTLNNTNGGSYSDNTIDAFEWTNFLEVNGAVFLPAAGMRRGTSCNGSWSITSNGYYWSSKHTGNNYAVELSLGTIPQYTSLSGARYDGLSVRLVHSVESTTYSIGAISNPTEGGIVNGSGMFENGQICTLTASPNEGYTFINWTENNNVVSTDSVYSFQVTANRQLVANFSNLNVGNGLLNGVFSVNENIQVSFSRGNLQYQASTNTWRFADSQWDYVGGTDFGDYHFGTVEGSTNNDISPTYSGWIDVFGWGTSGNNHGAVCYQPWGTCLNNSDYYAYGSPDYNLDDSTGQADWGNNVISNGGNSGDQWRTLNQDEWNYLLFERATISGMRYVLAKVNEVEGLILLPDTWDNSIYSLYTSVSISASAWINTLEPNGAVFLPAAGERFPEDFGFDEYFWRYVNWGSGHYWATTHYDNNDAYYMYFDYYQNSYPSDVSATTIAGRLCGLSVRLVKTIQPTTYYNVSTSVNLVEGGTVSGAGEYEEGYVCTLTATPNEGFRFINWTENDVFVSDNSNYTFNVWSDHNFVANFGLQITDTSVVACDNFTWHGHSYSYNGIYCDTLTSYSGIDSIVALHLTINPSYHNTISITECDSYYWQDSLYTESGQYVREYQTVHECDSVLTLNLTINPTRPLGNFTYLIPANDYICRYADINFAWDTVHNANTYDLYFWQGDDGRPMAPTVAGLTSSIFHYNGLQNNATYHWCVVAKNECVETESSERTFTCQMLPMLSVIPQGIIEFGEIELGQSRTKTIAVSATALTENISYSFLDNAFGQDSEFFNITPSTNWNSANGGSLQVTFTPDATHLYYNTALRIVSGTLADTIYLTGSLANRFVFSTNVEESVYTANDEITITGHVEDILGNAVSNLDVDVYLIVMGSRIILPTVSDTNGDYSVVYSPRYSESGYYKVGSCEKGKNANVEHDAFDIPGMGRVSGDFVVWQVPQNNTLTGSISIRNRCRIPLGNIQVTPVSVPDGCTVNFTGTSLGSLETGELQYIVSGTALSTGSNYEEATFLISSDAGITMNLTCYYYCYRGRSELDVYPYSIATTMTRNRQKMLSFQITNNGEGETGPITIGLPDVEWMSVMGGNTLESVPVGDSCAFTIKLAPDDNVSLNQYTGTIAVNCANGNGFAIPYQLEATSDSTGTLVVDVTDDYTYNTNDGNGPHLAGANVTITGLYSLQTVAQGVTGEDGHFVVEDIPEGYYYLIVQARSHKEYNRHIIYIEGGKMHWKEVYLQFQAISYSWIVVPTEIPDEYEYELVCDFKTNVPVPVVILDYPQVMDSLAYGDSLQFNITITNYGLIDAHEVQLVPPTEFEEYDFYPLFDFIDTLHAKSSVTIPCTMTRTSHVRADNNTDCVPGYWKTYDYWYCNRKKIREIKQDRVWIARMCPPKDIDYPPTIIDPPYDFDDDEEWVFDWDFPTIPPILPPDLPPVVFPTLPPLPNLPNQTTIIPQNNVEYVTPTSDEDCYPCWKVWGTMLIEVVVPVFSGYMVCFMDAGIDETVHYFTSLDNNEELTECITVASLDEIGNLAGGAIYELYSFVTQVIEVTQKIHNCVGYRNNDLTPEAGMALDQLEYSTNYYQFLLNEMTNLFQEEEWKQETNLFGFLADFHAVIDTSNNMISPQAVQQLKESCEMSYVNDSIIQRFADRWNRSVQYWNEGYFTIADLPIGYDTNFIQKDTTMMILAQEAVEAAEAYGFSNIQEMLESSMSVLKSVAQEHTNDVCSKVSVSFKHYQNMTREAFEGTLKVYNGHGTDAMENIDVDIVIKDANGVDKTSLFQINVVSLDQISGVDGTGILDAQNEGIVQFQIIPTIAAAPDSATIYSFGGSFTFLDPFSGETMTYQLSPVELTVNPSPNLHVDYFVQRNIISDDPLTDTIETAEPAEIAMMIRNVGAGDANNVYLERSQPTIVDNENGLLVQFDMIGAVMNGEQRPLSLTDIPFGTIRSHTARIAEWYFTSSLMGRIIHSTPHVIHTSSYGNPDLSLVTELNSHELIKAIRAYSSLDDGINDFFVNETVDFNHTPDKIYFSHGGTAGVKKVLVANTEGVVSTDNNIVLLNVNPITVGWNYACVDDPGQGLYEIISCTRDDGQEIPLNNVWVTHVTMFDDDAPIHENKLHIVDTVAVAQTTTYTLIYANEPSNLRIFHGNEDEYWSNAANWEDYILPQVNDEVLIDGICELDEDAEVFALTVAENQSLTIPEDRILTVSGSLTNADASGLVIEEGGQLMHTNAGAQGTVQKNILPFTAGTRDGWYLVAPPLVGNTAVTSVADMLYNNYDLYYYDEPTHYWINEKDANNHFTELTNGKGYLYANNEEVILRFEGELQSGSATITVLLNYTDGIDLAGFNLVGNPYAHNVTSYASVNVANGCYQINETKDDFIVNEISEANPLKPAEGFFVKATGEGASVTFNPGRGETANHNGSIYVELLYDGKLIDRLIVMSEGDPLRKFSLNNGRAKVFAMLDHREVAIVPYEGNEQPVNFMAARNGTFTINVNTKGMEFNYLHLIDNLTGADVDLLALRQAQGPMSYTFEAKTTDYDSRFKLVFSVSGDENDEDAPFAFINNGNIVIVGAEADATLQIVDVLGRVMVCRDASNASAISTTGMVPGVYVLRLIEGEKERTQKIIIQ